MRDFLNRLEQAQDIRYVDREVDPTFELAAVVQASQQDSSSAILFRKVAGTRFPVVSNLYGDDERLAQLLGVNADDFGEGWWRAMQRLPQMADSAFCTVPADPNLVRVTLPELPHIIWQEKDGGPYISAGIFYARDPETGVGNLSFCRSLMVDDRLVSCFVPFHDLADYQRRAEALGKTLEVAVLIGAPPEVFLAACASLPLDMDEMVFAAAIKGEAIEMRPCSTIDLDVPADTQIVIEGRVRPREREPEGPFGEFMGYYGDVNMQGYVIDVLAVDTLPDAVFHGLLCGSAEDMVPLNRAFAARAYVALRETMPDVVLEVSGNPIFFVTVVRIRKTSDDQPAEIIARVFERGARWTSMCIVVDEDVDPHDTAAVLDAYVTRGRVDERLSVLTDDQLPRRRTGGRVGIDATTPMGERDRTERTRIPGAEAIDLRQYLA
ncbi:UbiD family decarboxylase [Rhizorhabdus sp.]|uniref:UbiD family decarboxylase n=1 Tax=Rhizorhabdus sp. TaxID=1968843 RepID=UPI0019A24BC1|nr:UbiD family decarboxylase [Rhizorhabdus sp.]MBD3760915.1 UbiD family decarboxylase [Rhizorhabdus sp.]